MVCYDKILHNRRKISNVPRSKHYISLVVYKHKGGQPKLPAFQTFRLSVFCFQSFSSELHIRYIDKA